MQAASNSKEELYRSWAYNTLRMPESHLLPLLYHIVPSAMTGSVLHPMSVLARTHPALAAEAAQKYRGREHLMAVGIPCLGCRWNDVIHLAPLHPAKTRKGMESAGLAVPALRFFAIPPERLATGDAVYFANQADTGGAYDFPASEFEPFERESYRELASLPAAQERYFQEAAKSGARALLWARTPHVLYRGSIDVGGLEVLSW